MARRAVDKKKRFEELYEMIKKEGKVSLTKVAMKFGLSDMYAYREFRNIGEFFDDVVFDGKYFYRVVKESEKASV